MILSLFIDENTTRARIASNRFVSRGGEQATERVNERKNRRAQQTIDGFVKINRLKYPCNRFLITL